MIARFALVAALVISNVAFTQSPPAGAPAGAPSQPGRISGTVTAIDGSAMTVKNQDGTETRLTFKPGLKVLSARPLESSEIKVGTVALVVSKAQPAGKESVVAIRLVEADAVTDPEGSGPGPQPGTAMTNGKVTKVTRTDAGQELDITYPGGVRQVLLPSGARVINTFVVGQGALKPGVSVTSQMMREPDGTASTGAIMVMPPGAGPPGAGPPPGAPPR